MKTNNKISAVICLLLFITACDNYDPVLQQSKNDIGNHSGPYLGQEVPADKPELFAPGIISTGMYERDLTISPDGKEIYFTVMLGRYQHSVIMVCKRKDDIWQSPEIAAFAKNTKYKYLEPSMSPDGMRLYFVSDIPTNYSEEGDENIWYIEKTESGWGEPVDIGEPVNSELPDFFPSVTSSGNIYLTRDNPKTGASIIYRSVFADGKYSEPEALPEEVNAGRSRFNAYIAPDESYIIVPIFGKEDSYGRTDYYISYRNEDDTWTGPFNLGPEINTPGGEEYSPYVTPDQTFFFFMRADFKPDSSKLLNYEGIKEIFDQPQNGYSDIYWSTTDFIDQLRPLQE